MNMNSTLFQEISFQVAKGNPWWGLATCNEYENVDPHIRGALVSILRRRLDSVDLESPLAVALIRGQRSQHLPESLRARIGTRVCRVIRHPILSEGIRKRTPRVAARRPSHFALHGRNALTHPSRRVVEYRGLSLCIGEAP